MPGSSLSGFSPTRQTPPLHPGSKGVTVTVRVVGQHGLKGCMHGQHFQQKMLEIFGNALEKLIFIPSGPSVERYHVCLWAFCNNYTNNPRSKARRPSGLVGKLHIC